MKASLPKVVSLARTCYAMPAQWEGRFADGRTFYARFRHGSGGITVSPEPQDGTEGLLDWPALMQFSCANGHGFEGDMSDRQFLGLLAQVAEVPPGISIAGASHSGEWDTEDTPDQDLLVRVFPAPAVPPAPGAPPSPGTAP